MSEPIHCRLDDGTDVVIRPIRPEDARIEADFVRNLSARAKYFRFMHSLNELTPEMVERFTRLDHEREVALIAVVDVEGEETEIGVARFITGDDATRCEFALVVADAWQRRGIGSRLMTELLRMARERGHTVMEGEVLASNADMLRLVRGLGFHIGVGSEGACRVWRELA